MLLVFIILFCVIVALGFTGAAAWSDFLQLIIPNIYVLLIGAVFVPAFALTQFFAPDAGFFGSWKNHLFSAGLMFIITYVLFHFKVMGGGDAKLLTAVALWTGVKGLMPMLFMMAIVGGVLGAITLLLNGEKISFKTTKSLWIEKAQQGEKSVPYGIAIFVGTIFGFWHAGYIQPNELMALASIKGNS
jgi:prepilin peptidase CpaA